MEKKGNNETEKPLILISPPGSIEARQIGYINIPNIAKDPPSELLGERGLHGFTNFDKDNYLPKWAEEIKDDDDHMYYLQASNVWILSEYVKNIVRITDTRAKRLESTDKGRVSDPLFPSLLRFALKWILCEYGLYCLKQNAEEDLVVFAKNIIGRHFPDKWAWFSKASSIGMTLHEKRWRGAKEPIRYLRFVIARRIKAEEVRNTSPIEGVDGDDIFSLNQPFVTGNTADILDDLTPLDLLLHKIPDENKDIFIDKSFEASEDEDFLNEVCRRAELSPTATLLMREQILNDTTLGDVAAFHNLSKQQYDAGRQELHRKKSEIVQIILGFWEESDS